MSDDWFTSGLLLGTFVGLLGGILIGILIGMTLGSNLTYDEIMAEAHSRGYAVQCLGKTGYHWECEE